MINRALKAIRRHANRSEEGQGLAYVLVIGTVLLVFLIALVNVLVLEEKWVVGSARRSQLVAAGDAAIDRALYKLQMGGNWDSLGKGLIDGYHNDVVYSDQPGIRYTIQVLEGNWTPTVYGGVTSTGYIMGDPKLERTIIVSLSNSKTGERRKIEAVIIQTVLNSAIFSGGQIQVGGSADAHWGPVVSYSSASDSIPLSSLPTHPIFMSYGGITIGGVSAESAGKWSAVPSAGVSVYSNNKSLGTQPTFDTLWYKQQALTGMAASPSIGWYESGAGSCSWAGGLPAVTDPDETVVFYDNCLATAKYDPTINTPCGGTCSGNAIGADVKVAGNWCGQGTLVVMGNLDTKGTGCSMSLTMTPPTDCYPKYDTDVSGCTSVSNPDLFWNGFIYVAGALSSSGNKKVYGTIYAYDTAGITGNFSIWYKSQNSTLATLGRTVFTKLWLERKPIQGDVFP